MYVSIVEYHVRDVDEASWSRTCEELAPEFAQVPGLMAKIWLHGEGDVRGGIYVWLDKAASDRFLAGDLVARLRAHPNVAELAVREYGVDEAPTEMTRGMAFGAAWAAQYTR